MTPESRMLGLSLFKNPYAFHNWLSIYNPDAISKRFFVSGRDYSVGLPSPVYFPSLLGLNEILIELFQSLTGGASSGAYIHKDLLDKYLRGHWGGPLHAAAAEGNLNIVKILLEADASIDLESFDYGTPLSTVSLFRHGEAVKHILDSGADVHGSGDNFGNALEAAADRGKVEAIGIMFAAGADCSLQAPM